MGFSACEFRHEVLGRLNVEMIVGDEELLDFIAGQNLLRSIENALQQRHRHSHRVTFAEVEVDTAGD